MIEDDPDFAEEFNRVLSDSTIPESEDYIPEVLEDTYINTEISVPRDYDGPEFAKVTKVEFEIFEGSEEYIPKGYQKMLCHMIFDVKIGDNFRRKDRMVAGGHRTATPSALTYSSVVSRDSVRIALTITAKI